jgi:GT2 family glycosyltransferase
VIDGGSTDGSTDVIRRYADHLTYWVSEPDSGQGEAINKGWARCRGDLVAYLNSDDYYLPGAISAVVAAWLARPDAGVICGQAHWVDERGTPLQTTRARRSAQQLLDRLESLPQPAVFVTRAVLDRVGLFDPTLHYSLDKEYYLRALGNFDIVYLDQVLACMRLHDAAKSVAAPANFAPEQLRVARRIVERADHYPRLTVTPAKVFSRAHLVAARFLFMAGRYRPALRQLARAYRLSPAYRAQIVTQEAPRFLLRLAAGRARYNRLSALLRNLQRTARVVRRRAGGFAPRR